MLGMADATALLINGGWIVGIVFVTKTVAVVVLRINEQRSERIKEGHYR
jgi:hypothetical protein